MKLFSLQILYKTDTSAKLLQASHDLSNFGYFQRSSVREFMDFTAKLVGERTARCQRRLIKEQDYICHVYVRHDNLCGVLICDQEYPQTVAQTLLTKATEDFALQYSAATWTSMADGYSEVIRLLHEVTKIGLKFSVCGWREVSGSCKKIDEYLQKYQNPSQADGLMRLQNELDETKVILHNTLESLLSRGEKLDDLVERSEGLSLQSKMFYTTAKKTNKCCVIL